MASQIWYREDGSKRRETLYEDGKDFGRGILIRINTFLKKIKPLLLIQIQNKKITPIIVTILAAPYAMGAPGNSGPESTTDMVTAYVDNQNRLK